MTTNALPADLAEFVRHEVAVGHYNSAEEVICDSLRLLQSQQEQLEQLHAELQPALDELDRGEGIVVKESEIRSYVEGLYREAISNLDHK